MQTRDDSMVTQGSKPLTGDAGGSRRLGLLGKVFRLPWPAATESPAAGAEGGQPRLWGHQSILSPAGGADAMWLRRPTILSLLRGRGRVAARGWAAAVASPRGVVSVATSTTTHHDDDESGWGRETRRSVASGRGEGRSSGLSCTRGKRRRCEVLLLHAKAWCDEFSRSETPRRQHVPARRWHRPEFRRPSVGSQATARSRCRNAASERRRSRRRSSRSSWPSPSACALTGSMTSRTLTSQRLRRSTSRRAATRAQEQLAVLQDAAEGMSEAPAIEEPGRRPAGEGSSSRAGEPVTLVFRQGRRGDSDRTPVPVGGGVRPPGTRTSLVGLLNRCAARGRRGDRRRRRPVRPPSNAGSVFDNTAATGRADRELLSAQTLSPPRSAMPIRRRSCSRPAPRPRRSSRPSRRRPRRPQLTGAQATLAADRRRSRAPR